MDIENRDNKIYAYVIFLIWPLLSVWFAIKNHNTSWAKNIIWLFVAFYSYTMVISDEGTDANRYRDNFIEIANNDTDEQNIKIYEEGEQDSIDFLQPFINYIVSKFTNNYKVLFAIFGLIFGFFYSRNIWMLFNRIAQPISFISIILLLTFLLINPFWNINGFRFWTAAQVFIYGILLYFIENKKSGILFISSTFMIHFSFMLPILIFLIYMLLGNRITVYFYFFIASMFINELQLDSVRDNLVFLPDIIQERTSSYVSDEYKESVESRSITTNWYVRAHRDFLRYSIYTMLIILYLKGRKNLKAEKILYHYFGFILLFYGVANIISYIPSAGRFLNPAASMAISLILVVGSLYAIKINWFNNILKVTIPFLLLFVVVALRIGFDTIGITTIFGNPVFSIFMEDDKALIELIK